MSVQSGAGELKFNLTGSEEVEDASPSRRRRWILGAAALVVVAVAAWALLAGAGKKPAPGGASGSATTGAAAAGSTAATSDDKDKEKEKKAPVPVAVETIANGSISAYASATANLVAEDEVKVLAETEGRVASVMVEEGDRVRRGQPLAILAREEAEITAQKARLKEQNARQGHERGSRMRQESVISQEAFDKLTMENDIARQELADAEWRLSRTTIRAPFDGRVTLRSVRPGQHVSPGNELFVVADFEPLIARVYLPERDILGLHEGQEVRLTLKADEKIRFAGAIRQISPVVDVATGTVKLTIEAVEPPPAVRPGGFVTVDIVRETRQRAVLLPRQAVLRELQSAHVFLFKDGVAQKRAVTLGLEEGAVVEALSGVLVGEQVITTGQGGLRDGSPVKLPEAPNAAPAAATATAPAR